MNTVYCTYATLRGHALVGARIWVPAGQLDDEGRRAELGIPADVVFTTKPQLAKDIVTDMAADHTMPPWFAGDEVYGRSSELREYIETQAAGYVLRAGCCRSAEIAGFASIWRSIFSRQQHRAGNRGSGRPGRGAWRRRGIRYLVRPAEREDQIRMSAPSQTDRWPAADALLLLLAAVIFTGGASLWVSFRVSPADRPLVAVFGGVMSLALCVAVVVAARRGRQARQIDDYARSLETEFATLAEQVLPGAVRRLRDGASADTVIAEVPQPLTGAHRHILHMVAREIGIGERQRAAAMAACASAAGRVQAMATSMLADLREMEGRHSEEVLGDLLKLDHSTA
ncbi:MAG: hypothetical protein GEV28_32630, partial [Actinophytocola sp.]|nr:hypothetical protein [Actinophytocola sp.]